MGKPRAQIQKEYRERKKQLDEEKFLEKERKRVKKYYVKTNLLTNKEKKERRKSTLERVRRFRKSKQTETEGGQANETMIVAMDFPSQN